MKNLKIYENEALSHHCNYKTGGFAKYFATPINNQELQNILLWAKEKDLRVEVIGGGCNILISDEGYDGLIISTALLNRFICSQGMNVSCGAGIALMELVMYSIDKGLSGFEYLAGIPGCIGGALKMNAGAFDAETKDVTQNICVMDFDGKESVISAKEAGFEYRKSTGLDGFIITEGEFLLTKSDVTTLNDIKTDILAKRKAKQPLEKPSCGSVFKRPDAGFVGTYIEECGLKGLKKGGAVISEKHANFILNFDNAKSSDIKWLIDTVIERVYADKGVRLETEVKLIGFEK